MKKSVLFLMLCCTFYQSLANDSVVVYKATGIYVNALSIFSSKLTGGVERVNGVNVIGVEFSYYLGSQNLEYSNESSNSRKGSSLEFFTKRLHKGGFKNTTYHSTGFKLSYEEYRPIGQFDVDSMSVDFDEFFLVTDEEGNNYYRRYGVKKGWLEANFKYGKRWYKKSMYIDFYGGLGIRGKYTQHFDYLEEDYIGSLNVNGNRLRDKKGMFLIPSVKMGLNLGLLNNRVR